MRKRVPAGTRIMVDYNQALTVAKALARGRALDDEGVYWLEEPIRHDDYAGAARLARELNVPVQIGENFSEPNAMAAAIAAGACDYVMPDLERIGGVTGWQRAAALAAAHRIEMSSHLFPESGTCCGDADGSLAGMGGLAEKSSSSRFKSSMAVP